MKSAFLILVLAAAAVPGNRLRVDLPGVSGSGTDQDFMQYDDGSPHWLTWDGTYRGTWFNTQDFAPATYFYLLNMEYWFFEHSSYPWDTADFYSEIWNGDNNGPTAQLAQGIVTAVHYAPCYHSFPNYLHCMANFWGVVNTEMSGGGWPSLLADGTGYGTWPPVCHSFFSDDFIMWEEWSSPAPAPYGDFFIRASGLFLMWGNLNATTWGSVKSLF